MRKTFLSLHRISASVVGLLAAGACLIVGTGVASAQQGGDPLDTSNERTSDPFSSTDNNDYSPFFDLMHRVQLGNIRSVSEYSRDQQQSIGSEATDFRNRQRLLLEQGNQDNPAETMAPSAAPAPTVSQ